MFGSGAGARGRQQGAPVRQVSAVKGNVCFISTFEVVAHSCASAARQVDLGCLPQTLGLVRVKVSHPAL